MYIGVPRAGNRTGETDTAWYRGKMTLYQRYTTQNFLIHRRTFACARDRAQAFFMFFPLYLRFTLPYATALQIRETVFLFLPRQNEMLEL